MNRMLVISDIHGMYNELMLLLKASSYNPAEDRLAVLGDYIDRGYYSRNVIEFFMDLKGKHGPRVTLLKGNHEDLCLKAHFGDERNRQTAVRLWMANMGDRTLASFNNKIPDEVLSFLKKMRVYAETEQFIFVHAGVHPSLPLSKMRPADLMWSGSSAPHSSGKMVVVGHAIRDDVTYYPKENTLYIDTGAFQSVQGRTGKLSMVDLTNSVVHWVNTGGSNDGTYEVKGLTLNGGT